LHTALQLARLELQAARLELAVLAETRSGIQMYWSLLAAAGQGLEYWADWPVLQILAPLGALLAG
jgi:hypothetical protein